MFITYPCPNCLYEQFANDKFIGKHITCSMCSRASLVPEQSIKYTAEQQRLKWEYENNHRITGKWGPRPKAEENERSTRQNYQRSHQQSSSHDNVPPSIESNDLEKYYGRILELKGNVTFADIRRQYKHLASQYHPDKVNHLGAKLRIVAEQEMKELNLAFEFFKMRHEK